MRLLLSVLLVPVLVACGNESDEVATVPTVRPTSTPSLRWLTIERQERLADEVSSLALHHGWAAGCVFRWNPDPELVADFTRAHRIAGYSLVSDPLLAPALLLFAEGGPSSGSYEEQIVDAATFCYVPD